MLQCDIGRGAPVHQWQQIFAENEALLPPLAADWIMHGSLQMFSDSQNVQRHDAVSFKDPTVLHDTTCTGLK